MIPQNSSVFLAFSLVLWYYQTNFTLSTTESHKKSDSTGFFNGRKLKNSETALF